MKRRIATSLVLIMFFSMSMFPLSARAEDSWPMFHHDLTHSGYSTSTAPNTNHTLWTYAMPPGANHARIGCSPAVAGGQVYISPEGTGKVYALDAFTGTLIWSYTTDSQVLSSPTIANGKIYIGSVNGKV